MKVCIDAKWYFEGPASGKVVIRNIVDDLLQDQRSLEIILILKSKDKGKFKELPHIVKVVYVPNLNNLILNVFLIPFFIRKNNVDVFLGQNFIPFWGSFKKIAYIHDILFVDFPEYYTFIEKMYFSILKIQKYYSDYIVTVSETEKKRIIDRNYSLHPDKVSSVYHGVSESFKPYKEFSEDVKESFNKRYPLPSNFILFVGRLNKRKNISNLLQAFDQLDEVNLVIAGAKDWKEDSINEKFVDHERINWLGHVSGSDLCILFSKADVFVFPSYAESFGLPPIEAMKSGTAVVVSERTCLPEVCKHGALFFDPDNIDQIKNQIKEVLSSKDIRLNLEQNGIEVAMNYSWKESVNNLSKILKNVAKDS